MFDTDQLIAAFAKNARGEEVRISIGEYRGKNLCNARVYYPDAHGDMQPGKGLSIRVEQLPDLAAGIAKAIEAAKRQGLIDG